MSRYWKLRFKTRSKFFRSNYFLPVCVIFIVLCLFINQRSNSESISSQKITKDNDRKLFIDRIRDIIILDQNVLFNITYDIHINDIPKWLNRYGITSFFNFHWLQNEGYLWHLQRMMDLKQNSINRKTNFNQIFLENFNQTNIFNYLHHHPEYGVIIDTASDPIQLLFPALPRTSLSLTETCEKFQWLNNWYPCYERSEMISSFSLQPLITYALYDVIIDICDQCKHSSSIKNIHYDELIYLFDSKQQITNETMFVRQILPRWIRLLAVVPTTAFILLPHLNSKRYVNQYMNVLLERGLADDRKRFIEYNSSQIYHTNVLYSTSSPRSDLILLNKILLGDKPPVRRELILIIRNHFDVDSYNEIVQTINQFELPEDFEYLHVYEYEETSYSLNEIGDLFRQARIVIGVPTDILSHIVWCLPGTHIIEIIQNTMTTDYYEISLQLRFNYWLAMTTKTNKIDIIDFRNLMMRVLTEIDV